MSNQQVYRPPSYYIKKRFFSNKPAVIGMIIILVFHTIAILGYLIMPDSTPYANDSAIQIGKKTPGFSVTMLKIRSSIAVEDEFFFTEMIFGQPSDYTVVPITDYRIDGLTVAAQVYSSNQENKYNLVELVKPLYAGKVATFDGTAGVNYREEGDKIIYLDRDKKVQSTTKESLIEDFKKNNIEKRHYLLGTDRAGRDQLSRLIFGARISLAIGFISVIISLLVGVSLGALAGFFGGIVDHLVMWFMTVVWSIPSVMLVIAISLALQSKGVGVAFIAVGLTTWVEIARVVRGQILSIKEKLYIEAARAFGIKTFRIIYRHILPNMLGPLIVITTSNFATAILVEAGLSFLGLSVQPPMPSWGMMINEGYHVMTTENSWHIVLMPSLCVSILVLAFNLFGNGLRDAYDPQTVVNKR
jgi:ABC-type dipeptide/oligopeptide/nickel transport system permease subunit